MKKIRDFCKLPAVAVIKNVLFADILKNAALNFRRLKKLLKILKKFQNISVRRKEFFLQSADAFAASYDTLMKTAELIHKFVPSVKTIGCYARIDNFIDKTENQLREMKNIGFSDPYIGVESGDDEILKKVNKGYDAKTAREQLEKISAAGMSIIANFLNGLGGKNFGLSHAKKTAKLYEKINISMIEVSSLTLVPGTNLFYQKQRGKFFEATEVERLEEMQEFLRDLTNETIFLSDHISMPFFVKAKIPENKEKIIDGIQKIIDEVGEENLRRHREENPIM